MPPKGRRLACPTTPDMDPIVPTTLYLVRHAATAANLEAPPRLQGRRTDPPLAPLGVRQAEATRDLLAGRPIDACVCSPLRRAVETAAVIATPHRLTPRPLDDLTECDVGAWEGLSWEEVRRRDPDAYRRYMADPAAVAYPGGESFADVYARAGPALDRLLRDHPGQTLLVVSHHVVNRTYLAALLGLPLGRARRVSLDNCGVSVVVRDGDEAFVRTLNATFHLPAGPA
jgi:broad specificity phosphatase PhoE